MVINSSFHIPPCASNFSKLIVSISAHAPYIIYSAQEVKRLHDFLIFSQNQHNFKKATAESKSYSMPFPKQGSKAYIVKIKIISWLSDAFAAVLDCLLRAVTNTCHAVCTVPAPHRFAIHNFNII